MKSALRAVGAMVLGLFVSFVLVVAVEFFGSVAHPLPPDFGGTMEEMCRHVERFPPWVLGIVIPAWAATAFAGTWLARRMGNGYSYALVGLVLVAMLVVNLWMLPYPLWFKIGNLVAVPAAIVAAGRLATRKKSPAMEPAA